MFFGGREFQRPTFAAILGLLVIFGASSSARAQSAPSDDDLRDQIIRESLRSYRGSCPCPYNLARNGSRCGKRSAYSRHGGLQVLCFPEDINETMLTEWRRKTPKSEK